MSQVAVLARIFGECSKRDIELSNKRLLNDDKRYRCESCEGEVTFEHYVKIDNTDLVPDVVAKMIQERFGL